MSQPIIIATHSGTFHTDEVTAYAVLRYLFPANILIRTRDAELIDGANLAIDVGHIYDPVRGRFDHHQANSKKDFLTKPG